MATETLGQSPVIERFQSVINGQDHLFDETVTEGDVRQLLPWLLLAGEEEGISGSALGLSSAIQVTQEGISVKNARIQIDHPRFQGTVSLSVEFFNQKPRQLAARNLQVEVEGGNFASRALVGKLIKSNLEKPDQAIRKALKAQIQERTQGKRNLDRFEIQINPNGSLRIYLSTAIAR